MRKQTTVVQRISEEGVGGVREALLISLERTNTLSAYVYRDIRYNTTGIIQSGRNLCRNPLPSHLYHINKVDTNCFS